MSWASAVTTPQRLLLAAGSPKARQCPAPAQCPVKGLSMLVNEMLVCGPHSDSDLGLLTLGTKAQIQKSRNLTVVLDLEEGHQTGTWAAPTLIFGLFLYHFRRRVCLNSYMLLENKSSNFRENDKICTSMSPLQSLDLGPSECPKKAQAPC